MKSNRLIIAALAAATICSSTMAQSTHTIEAGGLKMHVFLSDPTIFEVSSVVLEGEREVALVDAQFSAANADRVADLIRSTGKRLTTIFVSYSDPDYYFGLDRIARQFPEAKVLATAQTVYLIEATRDEKMAIWAPQLGAEAPARIRVPEPIGSDHFMVDGHRVEIRRAVGDEQHAWLWIPSARTILGGVYLVQGEHLWVADSPARQDRARWLAALDTMTALRPAYAIPAHFAAGSGDFGGEAAIRFTRDYLLSLDEVLAAATGSEQVIARMKARWPQLVGVPNLEMTARVLTGEQAWKTVGAFPAIGRRAEVDFGGDYAFVLDFKDNRHMTYVGTRGSLKGATDSVVYTAVEVVRGVYMVYWTESDGTRVVHVEDYAGGVAYTNIASPDGSFNHLHGPLRLIED